MADATKEPPFFRIESLAVMGRPSVDETVVPPPSPPPDDHRLTLTVQPLRSRTLVATVAVVAALAALMFVFMDGVALTTFRAGDKTPTEETQLLNDYNAYSGNIATLFSKPVELFVTLGVHILVLSFMADAVARPTPSWTTGLVALALASAIGYLVRNGISALNVQLHVLETRPMVGASDLSVLANDSAMFSATSTVAHVLAEAPPQNAATNTILRNLLLPPPSRPATQCAPIEDGNYEAVAEPSLSFGIPQLDWQRRVLPQALNVTKRLRLVVNASAPATTKAATSPNPAELPMDASLAADLFLYAMIEAPRSLPWGPQLGFQHTSDWGARFPLEFVTGREVRSDVGAMADFMGLLPRASAHADETAQRAWLLRELVPSAVHQFNQSTNTSLERISLEYTHVDISPTLRFDALTIEAEVDPELLTDVVRADGTRYTNAPLSESCGPWAGPCLFKKPQYTSAPAVEFDPPAQIQAFSPCADANGIEKLTYVLNTTVRGYFDTFQCPQRSNSSVFVFSIAKRLVADTLVQNQSVNASDSSPNPTSAMATNLRKIYSFTIGRLSWQLDDLSETFHADCKTGNCHGLHLPLAPLPQEAGGHSSSAQQRIVVGVEALPLDLLLPYETFLYTRARRATLARVYEPDQPSKREDKFVRLAGDLLLPHNIGNITWDTTLNATSFDCNDLIEDRLRLGVENHFYMEHSLQPAYTAATLFLFQRAVVRTEIALPAGARPSLDFVANAQPIALWISIPAQNAYLTLAGCALLVLGIFVAVYGAAPALDHISAPQTIARVLLNEKQFPPLLLHRQVAQASTQGDMTMEELDKFQIATLTLEPGSDESEPLDATLTQSKDDTDRFSHKV